MTAEKILQSDILDIVFEGRNKLYGAYELRRTYHHRLKQGIGGMILATALLAGGYYLSFGKQNNLVTALDFTDTVHMTMIADPAVPPKPQLPPPPRPAPPPEATIANTAPLIVANLTEPDVPTQAEVDTAAISTHTRTGLASTGVVEQEPSVGPPGGGGGQATEPISTPASVIPAGPVDMRSVDELPQYPGGTNALVRYMVNNLTSELESGVKYVLKAQFVINEEGNVSEAIILSSDEPALNQQVLKAIRKMKQWKPGRMNGKNVAVRFTMPVTFMGGDE